MILQKCYIYSARLIDAPQVRIKSIAEPFMSIESCKTWCEKNTFSWIIREWSNKSPSIEDKVLLKA